MAKSRPKKDTTPPVNFNDLLIALQTNVTPTMREDFAESLGVSADAIRRLGCGWYPAESCWIFPERDATGKIVGLLRRYDSGEKRTWLGSHRGLYYDPAILCASPGQTYDREFIRVSEAGVDCPLCGKPDWCLVSDENPDDPTDVICPRTTEGAERYIENCGYLHHRHPERANTSSSSHVSVRTIIAPEGASDLLAVMDFSGYEAIGRPSASDGADLFAKMVQDRDVILVGDRDENGAGQAGLAKMFRALEPVCKSLITLLPPPPFKDIRQWHPTVEQFEAHLKAAGVQNDLTGVLPTIDPRELALGWLKDTQTDKEGRQRLYYLRDSWWTWNGSYYDKLAPARLHDQLSTYFAGKRAWVSHAKDKKTIEKLAVSRHFVEELTFAIYNRCYVDVSPDTVEPFLICGGAVSPIDSTRIVVFRNGMLDVTTDILTPPTPRIFLSSTLPYDYHPGRTCCESLELLDDIFQADSESIALLQEFFGYSMTPDNSFESMLFLIGESGAGKGTVFEMLEGLLGKKRISTFKPTDAHNQFATARWFDRYAVLFSEEDNSNKRDNAKILAILKKISGGDSVNIEEKYEKGFEAKLFCRVFYSANSLPEFEDASRSLARRLNILMFNHVPAVPDHGLKRRIVQEAPGLAIWAIEGLKRLLARDKFTRPAASEEVLQDFEDLANPLGATFEGCLVFSTDGSATKDALYSTYCAICEVENEHPLARGIFFSKFRTRYRQKIAKDDARGTEDKATGKRSREIRGVSLTRIAQETYPQTVICGVAA